MKHRQDCIDSSGIQMIDSKSMSVCSLPRLRTMMRSVAGILSGLLSDLRFVGSCARAGGFRLKVGRTALIAVSVTSEGGSEDLSRHSCGPNLVPLDSLMAMVKTYCQQDSWESAWGVCVGNSRE